MGARPSRRGVRGEVFGGSASGARRGTSAPGRPVDLVPEPAGVLRGRGGAAFATRPRSPGRLGSVRTSLLVYAGLLGFVALCRLAELVVSARRRRGRAVVSEPGTFPLLVAVQVGLLTLPWIEAFCAERPFRPLLAGAAGGVFVLASGLRVWLLWSLGSAWNVRVVPPEAVVTRGPYAWIRHPNYSVLILEVASLPLIHGAWASALGLSALNGLAVGLRVRNEEAALAELPGWRAAFADKKRFVPGLF
ncbi:MAG: hypothetical protein D6731_21515 [Planctomycetota bacterium]|nr:MAG: hypothetical protein D6731_21515 [Planctomycetota bacterium]